MKAIIPCRMGSKRLPRKNVKLLGLVPLFFHTLRTALDSLYIDHIYISTDDVEEIKLILSNTIYTEEKVSIIGRKKELATDESNVIDTYLSVCRMMNIKDEFIALQPTSPLRNLNDINNCIRTFNEKEANCVMSVCESPYPPLWNLKISEENILSGYFNQEMIIRNSQDEHKAYYPNGAIFVLDVEFLKKYKTYHSNKTYGYVMPRKRSIDIDTQFDFDLAEFILKNQ